MKAALVWAICCFAAVSAQFPPFGPFPNGGNPSGQVPFGPNPNGGGSLGPGPQFPTGCLPPSDSHSTTEYAPRNTFYFLGEKIYYRCRDRESNFASSKQTVERQCVGFLGEPIGIWTNHPPVCFRGCRNQCGVRVVYPEQCSCHHLCDRFFGPCCSNYDNYCIRRSRNDGDDDDDDDDESDGNNNRNDSDSDSDSD